MKPPPFEYSCPETLQETLGLLGDEAKVLAGGQSLVPLLNFRLARPGRIVDINRLAELAYIRRRAGRLEIGALTRQSTIERSPLVAAQWPLLRQAVRLVGHAQIRNRGTLGGTVAHADPTAEVPVALTALDARFRLRSRRGSRTLTPEELFVAPLVTAIADDELLVGVDVPALPSGAGTAFLEHARTHGDFAVAGAAVVASPGTHAAICLLGAGPRPVRAAEAERALLAGADAREAANLAVADLEGGHRRALLAELVCRALEQATK